MASLEEDQMDPRLAFLISEISLEESSESTDQSESSFASLVEMQQKAFLDLEQQQNQMMNDVTGKAWKFVERVIQSCQTLSHRDERIGPVSLDSLVDFTERLMVTQNNFRLEGKPHFVDIGYYYTSTESMESIRNNGIANKMNKNGSRLGLFTGSDPYEFHGCGNKGLMVLRLQGFSRAERGNNYDCIKGVTRDDRYSVVLNNASQCVALVEFEADMIDMTHEKSPSNSLLYRYHYILQNIVDEFFNDGITTNVARPMKTPRRQRRNVRGTGNGNGIRSN